MDSVLKCNLIGLNYNTFYKRKKYSSEENNFGPLVEWAKVNKQNTL